MAQKTLGQLVDELFDTREKKRAAEQTVKDISDDMGRLEEEIRLLAESQNLTEVSGAKAKVSIGTSVVPQVQDWDALYKYIARKKFWHLLERRPSVTGYRELLEQSIKVPGVVPFTKIKVNLKAI